jgi:hypothetical protein
MHSLPRLRRVGLVALALTLTLTSACGGKGNPAAPTPPAVAPFNQTITGTVTNFGVVYHPLTISRAGNMTLRLTWPDATMDLDLYLTASGCVQIYGTTACTKIAGSNSASGASETIARSVSSGEAFTIFVDSLALSRSTTYTLTLNIQ